MIFVDTGAWFADLIPTDPDHALASKWLSENKQPLITTDYIIDEILTLLKVRGQFKHALVLGRLFFDGSLAEIYYLTPSDIQSAWDTFFHYADKEWSFTDCSSKVVIEKLGLTQAFAFDHHFRQFGTVTVVPELPV